MTAPGADAAAGPGTPGPRTSGPGTSGPDTSISGTSGPDISGPDISGPGTSGSGISGSGTSGSGASGSGTSGPDISGPDISGPGTSGSGISGSGTSGPGTSGSGISGPGISGSGASGSGASGSGTSGSGTSGSGASGPGISGSGTSRVAGVHGGSALAGAGGRVLVVDDEAALRRALATNLRARGHVVDLASTGEEALQLAARHRPDVVVLDLGLPGISGVEVIGGLRGWTRVPIIVLSARGAEHDKVAALDAGADDYVTKPFGMDELLARLRAALRRTVPADEAATVATGDFVVDLAAKRVAGRDHEVKLTPTEWGLVEVLVRNAGKLVGQRQLLQEVWGPQYGDETNYLRVHMAHIRRKLEPDPARPRYFITEPGMGYRFESGESGESGDEGPAGAGPS